MSEIDNNKSHSFIWSYPFFYYTLLKHYRKEKHGVSDIAPWMAVCFLTFWCGAIYMSVTMYLVGNCYPNYLDIHFFPEEYGWFNRGSIGAILSIPNIIFFLTKKRYLVYEQQFDALPLQIRKRGKKISWAVMNSGFVVLLLTMWWFANSAC